MVGRAERLKMNSTVIIKKNIITSFAIEKVFARNL
jgi:hypothetical protein